jgi:competence protein ComEA
MKPSWLILIAGVLIGLLAGGAVLLISLPERGNPVVLNPAPSPTPSRLPGPTPTQKPIAVQIKGQVAKPGIYTLKNEARLADLLRLAGGITQLADDNRVNEALLLCDGDYIYIPAVNEKIPETAKNAPGNFQSGTLQYDYPLDLNTASQAALESLPGIGPTKAADIIAFREQIGRFETVDALVNVPGIGPTTLDAVREYLFVAP